MQQLYRSGRYLFACSILAFGVIQFISGHFLIGLIPLPGPMAGSRFLLYLISTLLIAGGMAMMASPISRRAARFTGFILAVLFIYPHLILLTGDLHNGGVWTGTGEMLCLTAGAWILCGDPLYPVPLIGAGNQFARWLSIGKWLFAISQFIFALLHFIYADYIATLIPAWIPFPVFWAWFVGFAFLCAGISILVKIKTRLTCSLLGFMFLFWVFFLHAPRVLKHPETEPEWTSLFVALAFCGIYLKLAGQFSFGKKISISPHSR